MPSVSTKPFPTSSGIATAQNGERHIPSSTRPDGSKRKEIKIRPGYKPPEDVEVYKNKTAEAWKSRGNRGGVLGAEGLDDADNGSGIGAGGGANKNAKRREARKKAKEDGRHTANEGLKASEVENQPPSQTPPTKAIEELSPDPEAEKAKQVRSLKKKLRQARELREKKDKGDNLLPVQIGKIVKISELVRQLEGLGVSEDELDLDQVEPTKEP